MIHRYHLDDYYMVLDTCSGGVHVVDEIAYELIGLYESKSKDEIVSELSQRFREDPAEVAECYDQVTQLKEKGQLFAPDTFENMAGELKARTSGVVKALCLHVAHTCNLNCSYCFASQGKYHGERAVMSFEVGKQALDFLVAHSGSRRNLEVDFFGGEPLMNFQVVKDLVAYARSIEKEKGKNFRFTLTTNGMLIDDDVIDFANRECSNVVLSLDGRKEIHDRFRVDYAGRGSWEQIVPKFQKLVAARGGKNYYMRGTFTHANPDFLKDIQVMLDLGFNELSMEPVVCAEGDPSALTAEDLPIVMRQYEDLALTPPAPVIDTEQCQAYSAEAGYGFVSFFLSRYDASDNYLNTAKYYYRLYANDEAHPFTFTSDSYTNVSQPMTDVPVTFADYIDFFNYTLQGNDRELERSVNIYDGSVARWGVQAVYKGGGTESVSPISWWNTPTSISSVSGQPRKVIRTEYYDLSGRRISHCESGLYIKVTVFSDGTRQVSKLQGE